MARPVYDTISDPDRAFVFCLKQFSLTRTPNQKGICLLRDGETLAAVVYDWFTETNCFMHVAAIPGSRWMTRDFLHWTFHYPFVQQGLKRVTGWVEASNTAARKFDEHLGFEHEATLEGAGQSGVDVLLYTLKRKDCRYV